MTKLYSGLKLTSEDVAALKYHVVKFHIPYKWAQQDAPHLKQISEYKKWCRERCGYSWGYSVSTVFVKGDVVVYFVFESKEDMLLMTLAHDGMITDPMWPVGTRFSVYVYDQL